MLYSEFRDVLLNATLAVSKKIDINSFITIHLLSLVIAKTIYTSIGYRKWTMIISNISPIPNCDNLTPDFKVIVASKLRNHMVAINLLSSW